MRVALAELESMPAAERESALARMAEHLEHLAGESPDGTKVGMLADVVSELGAAGGA